MPEFQEKDREAILEFVRKYPFGMLAAVSESGAIQATHVPILTSVAGDRMTMRGHVMRKTAHWHAMKHSGEALLVFTGPDAPVLASELGDLGFGGTWNYMSVHVRGKLSFLPESELLEILRALKNGYETQPEAMFEHLPPDYVPSLIRAIEGFEIAVDSMEAVFKLSQNRKPAEFDRVIAALRARGGEAALTADEMAVRRSGYFAGEAGA